MYAKVGGISTKELNILEIEFLFLIDWNLTANAAMLQNYYVNLVRQHPSFNRTVKTHHSGTPTSASTALITDMLPMSMRVSSEIEWVD
ncbi:hypothetical protein HK104_007350 [Borealophlyctis nickersoniae]|nr:hypothetical protein HK104_007350 [Borealophlyctis nickersoniae]